MAESFLITAAYRGSQVATAPPQLTSSHMFFRLYSDASPANRTERHRGAAPPARAGVPAGIDDFGRTLRSGRRIRRPPPMRCSSTRRQPRPMTNSRQPAARPCNCWCRRMATTPFAWRQRDRRCAMGRMKDIGPANFGQLFPQLQAPVIPRITWRPSGGPTPCAPHRRSARSGSARPQLRDAACESPEEGGGQGARAIRKALGPCGDVPRHRRPGCRHGSPARISFSPRRRRFGAGSWTPEVLSAGLERFRRRRSRPAQRIVLALHELRR